MHVNELAKKERISKAERSGAGKWTITYALEAICNVNGIWYRSIGSKRKNPKGPLRFFLEVNSPIFSALLGSVLSWSVFCFR